MPSCFLQIQPRHLVRQDLLPRQKSSSCCTTSKGHLQVTFRTNAYALKHCMLSSFLRHCEACNNLRAPCTDLCMPCAGLALHSEKPEVLAACCLQLMHSIPGGMLSTSACSQLQACAQSKGSRIQPGILKIHLSSILNPAIHGRCSLPRSSQGPSHKCPADTTQ